MAMGRNQVVQVPDEGYFMKRIREFTLAMGNKEGTECALPVAYAVLKSRGRGKRKANFNSETGNGASMELGDVVRIKARTETLGEEWSHCWHHPVQVLGKLCNWS